MLYIRMTLSTVVGFYTSRVVLQTLGVVDYGILGLVSGLVSMWGFLNISMNSATSRFITFALGKGDIDQLKDIFNTAFQSHVLVALIVLLLSETIGLWILLRWLDIPNDRLSSAIFVFQFSIFSAIIGITQVPYSATIIAHEKLDIYAWLEILNVTLKLALVWLLQIISFDHLIVYSSLSLLLSLLILGLSRYYCYFHYPETHLHFHFHSSSFRPLWNFMSWELFAEASDSLRQQGISLFLNRFYSVIMNTASSIAIMVQGIVGAIGYHILTAFMPQIVQSYASNNIETMQHLIETTLKCVCVIMCLFSIPIIFELPAIFSIWLGNVPSYTVVFCRILLIDNIIGLVNRIIYQAIYSSGANRETSIIFGISKLLCIPIIFILLSCSFAPYWAYLSNIIVLLVVIVANLKLIKQKIPQFDVRSLSFSALQILFVVLIAAVPYCVFRLYYINTECGACIIALLYGLGLLSGSYFFLLDSASRSWINRRLMCICR